MLFLSKKFLAFLTIGLWGGLSILSIGSRFNFSEGLVLFAAKGDYSFSRYIQEICIYFLGNVVVFLLPGMIWICVFFKRKLSFPVLLFASFLASVISLLFMTTAFKVLVHDELNWSNFVIMLGALTLSGLTALFCAKTPPINIFKISKANVLVALLLLIAMVAFGWGFQDKILWVGYDDDFAAEHVLSIPLGAQSDLLENFGSVDSLKRHLLPYWDLEYVDRFGYSIIDPPFHIFTSLFLMLFFGPSFAVQSLNSLLVILLSFWFIWLMSEFGTVSKRYYVAGFFTPFLFSMLIVAFLAHPQSAIVLADHIHFMCFFSIAQFYCLIRKRTNLFLIFALLAFLTKYEALLFTFLGLWFYKSIFETKKGEVATLLTKYLILISPYVIVMFLIGLFRGDLGGYAEAFFVERFMRLDYFGILPSLFSREGTSGWASFSVQSTIEFLKYFMLGSVCLGLVIFIPQKDKMSRFFGQIAVVYFILVMISMEKRIHYISPLVFMSVIIALRMFICGRLKDENFLKTPGSSQGVG